MVKRPGFELSLVIKALDQGWQIDEKGQLLLSNDTRNVYVRMLTRTAKKIAELEEQLKEQEAVEPINSYGTFRCGNCKNIVGYKDGHGRGYQNNFCSKCGRPVKWNG